MAPPHAIRARVQASSLPEAKINSYKSAALQEAQPARVAHPLPVAMWRSDCIMPLDDIATLKTSPFAGFTGFFYYAEIFTRNLQTPAEFRRQDLGSERPPLLMDTGAAGDGDGADDGGPSEETQLLAGHDQGPRQRHARLSSRVLPIALVGGFGIAGTVAAIMFVYRYLICANPDNCQKEAYPKTVAAAVTLTNALSILLLGPVQRVGRWKRQAGLILWLVARGLSLVSFLLAVTFKSLILAFLAQALEGVSTDNLLHFNLNAVYVENAPDAETPRLLGLSLGLFMAGLVVGPATTSLFSDPRWGLYIGTAAFTVALMYLLSPLVPWPRPAGEHAVEDDFRERTPDQTRDAGSVEVAAGVASVVEPLLFFRNHPATLLHGLSLLAFTSGQAFFFPALLIHATTSFDFDSRQISVIVTTIAAASSLNLLIIVVLFPALSRFCRRLRPLHRNRNWFARRVGWDTAWACWSMLVFSVAAMFLLVTREGRQLYVVSVFCSFGNATPPFVKSHLSRRLPKDLKAMALAALALCETTGGLLSPILIGAAQAHGSKARYPVFAVITSGLIIAAEILFSAAAWRGLPPLLSEAEEEEVARSSNEVED